MKIAVVPVTPFAQNCSLIWCEETMKGAIVDPGGDMDAIQELIDQHKVEPERILATHGHLDHVGAAGELAAKLGVPIDGPHEEERFLIETLPEQCAKFGLPATEGFVPARWLTDGDQVSFGKIVLDVLHCPGHTPGHVVYHHPQTRLALVGDVLFQGSIGRTDFPRSDHAALISSIKEKLWPLGDETSFVSGHGPVSTFGQERATNPFVHD